MVQVNNNGGSQIFNEVTRDICTIAYDDFTKSDCLQKNHIEYSCENFPIELLFQRHFP